MLLALVDSPNGFDLVAKLRRDVAPPDTSCRIVILTPLWQW